MTSQTICRDDVILALFTLPFGWLSCIVIICTKYLHYSYDKTTSDELNQLAKACTATLEYVNYVPLELRISSDCGCSETAAPEPD